MNETIRQYWERTIAYWNKFNKTQKYMFISVFILTLLTFILLISNLSKTQYSLAYTELSASDAAAIKEYLKASGIKYQFSPDGSSVLVPSKNVTEVKIDVESQDMLQGGSIGYGIFRDNISNFGMTDNQFDVLSIDAKAGEVEQLIKALNGVSNAKVLLTLAESSVFIKDDDTEEASATAVIEFKKGFKVDQAKIDTIYNLVSKSVANLPLENITISNQDDEMLPSSKLSGGLNNSTNAASEQFLIKKQYEIDIQKSIQHFLGRIMGMDRVIVQVVSTLNFDQKTSQQTVFTPVNEVDNTGIERSVSEIQKSFSSEGGGEAGGTPGTGPGDVPGYPAGSGGGNTNSEESETIINYEINEINSSIVSSPFIVEDLTIFAGIEPFIADDPTSLSEETKEEIQEMLINIIGTSLANSGKRFSVEELSRKVTVIAQPFRENSNQFDNNSSNNLLLYSLIAVALVIGAVGAYYVISKRKSSEIIEEELSLASEYPSIDMDHVSQENQVRKQLESLAKKKPDEFVDLLRTWLVDE